MFRTLYGNLILVLYYANATIRVHYYDGNIGKGKGLYYLRRRLAKTKYNN